MDENNQDKSIEQKQHEVLKKSYGIRNFIIAIILFLCIGGLISYDIWQEYESQYVTIASWYIDDFDANMARNGEAMQDIIKTISKYDIVAIQGIDNVNESIDTIEHKPSCDLNKNANESADFHLIRNTLLQNLPENYNVLISQQSGDERFAVVFNKDKVLALAEGVLLPNVSQTSQLCDLNANDSSMKRSPFLVPFRANNYTFAVMTADIDLTNSKEEMDVLQYDFGYIAEWYGWNFGDVFLMGSNLIHVAKESCACQSRFDNEKYKWLFGNESVENTLLETEDNSFWAFDCSASNIVMLQKTFNASNIKYGVDKSTTEQESSHYPIWMKVKMKED